VKARATGPGPPEVLTALSNSTRRSLLSAIAGRGEATATAVAPELPVSRQAVVKHLEVLERAGLVEARRSGREVLYRVCPEPLDDTGSWLRNLASEWDARLHAIRRIAEEGD